MNTRALLVSTNDGWEGLWVDKELYTEGSPMNEGWERAFYFMALLEELDLVFTDFQTAHLKEEYEELMELHGSFEIVARTREDINEIVEFERQVSLNEIM